MAIDPEEVAYQVASLYFEAEAAIVEAVGQALLKTAEVPTWKMQAVTAQQALSKESRAAMAAAGSADLWEGTAGAAYASNPATLGLLDWHAQHGSKMPSTQAKAAVGAVATELADALSAVNRSILRRVDDVYAQVVGRAVGLVAAGGSYTTRVQAAQRAMDELAQRGIGTFVDRSGRPWRLGDYVDMATRTGLANAQIAGHEAALAESGLDLVVVHPGPRACPVCDKWARKVLTINGQPGTHEVVNEVTGKTMKVHVDATLAQARADGFQHPNCRCSIRAFIPGVTTKESIKRPPYDEAAYKAQQKQRALERQVRDARMRQVATVDPAQRADAAKAVARARGALKEHLAGHPALKARPDRVSIGKRFAPTDLELDNLVAASKSTTATKGITTIQQVEAAYAKFGQSPEAYKVLDAFTESVQALGIDPSSVGQHVTDAVSKGLATWHAAKAPGHKHPQALLDAESDGAPSGLVAAAKALDEYLENPEEVLWGKYQQAKSTLGYTTSEIKAFLDDPGSWKPAAGGTWKPGQGGGGVSTNDLQAAKAAKAAQEAEEAALEKATLAMAKYLKGKDEGVKGGDLGVLAGEAAEALQEYQALTAQGAAVAHKLVMAKAEALYKAGKVESTASATAASREAAEQAAREWRNSLPVPLQDERGVYAPEVFDNPDMMGTRSRLPAAVTWEDRTYTQQEKDALEWYTGSAHRYLNRDLRRGGDLEGEHERMTALMDSAFEKAPESTEPFMVARGVDGGAMQAMLEAAGYSGPEVGFWNLEELVGKTLMDKGFTSTSYYRDNGSPTDTAAFKTNVLLRIVVPPGSKSLELEGITKHKGEREVLLPRDTQYEVVRVTYEKGQAVGSHWARVDVVAHQRNR